MSNNKYSSMANSKSNNKKYSSSMANSNTHPGRGPLIEDNPPNGSNSNDFDPFRALHYRLRKLLSDRTNGKYHHCGVTGTDIGLSQPKRLDIGDAVDPPHPTASPSQRGKMPT